jgi:hypothetical protein
MNCHLLSGDRNYNTAITASLTKATKEKFRETVFAIQTGLVRQMGDAKITLGDFG